MKRGATLNELPELSEATQRRRTPLRRFFNWLLAPVFVLLMKCWYACGKTIVVHEDEAALAPDQCYVFAGWHEQLLGASQYMSREIIAGRRVVTLISPSVDGDLIANIAMRRGADVVRGSANHSGFGALRTLISAMRKSGSTSYVVTDGPKGPARESKPGAILLARMSRAPLVPLVCVASSEKRANSWDRLRIPSFFGNKVFLVGTPHPIPRELEDQELERFARELDQDLARMTAKAEEIARSPNGRADST